MNATHELAQFVSTTTFNALPAAVVDAAKTVILDGFANAVAGSQEPVAGKVAAYVTDAGGAPQAAVVNHSARLPAGQAAFVNGVSTHCLDYEVQGYPSAHGTSSILPAIAAVAEREHKSGADLLTAFVVGWDVQQRLRAAGERGDMRGFHPPGIVGPLGAAAAVANLLGLDTPTTQIAFGLAASRTGGLFGNNGTMTKATHPGNAARAGVESADLAARGVTSNADILHAHRGFIAAALGGTFDDALALDGIGTRFHLIDPGFSIKPFPAEIYMQWPLDAMTRLKARTSLFFDDVEEIIIEPPVFRSDLSRPFPDSGLDGKFSYEYVVAAALVQERVSIETFTDEVRFSEEMETTLKKISLRENPDSPRDKMTTFATVFVRTKDGRELVERSTKYEGAIGRPMSPETHAAKIADCFHAGGLGSAHDAFVGLVERMETVAHVSEIMRTLSRE